MTGPDYGAQAPIRYVDWINQHLGFNPRGQQHSNALSAFMLDDLRARSPRLDADYRSGAIAAKPNQSVHTHIAFRNVDLVLTDPMQPGPLHQVRAAIEHKTLMTAHGKARKNRYGDLIAYANHIHNHSLSAIAAASVIINVATDYLNPDEFAQGVVRAQLRPDRWQRLIAGTISLFADIPLRERSDEPNDQPEALTVILIEYDGRSPARLMTNPPAPQPGDPAHITAFYDRIVRLYAQRF
jgi:hypothetical protein